MGSDTISQNNAFATARESIKNWMVKMHLIVDVEDDEPELTSPGQRQTDTYVPRRDTAAAPRGGTRVPPRNPRSGAPAARSARPARGEISRSSARSSNAPEPRVDTAVFFVDSLISCTTAIKAVIAGTSVIVHFVNTDRVTSQRIIDTLSGAAFALNAKIKKVEDNTYLIAPHGRNINVVQPSVRRY